MSMKENRWNIRQFLMIFHLLVDLMGGNDSFSQRLDDMFALHGQGFADIGNEPSFLPTCTIMSMLNIRRWSLSVFGLNTKYSPGASDSWEF